MANIDAQAGLARARSHSTNTPGECLGFVYAAYGSVQSIGPGAGRYQYAIAGWNYATQKHPNDWNPPVGVPVYFGVSPTRKDKNKAAGDVGISMGGGIGWFTDVTTGRTGAMTLAARARQTARPYLGWTSDFLGHQLVNIGATLASSGGAVAITGSPLEQLGSDYVTKLQKALGITADGQVGPVTTKTTQSKVGTPADGQWGPNSTKALQAFVGTTADGQWGPLTTAATKAAIDAGKFGAVPGTINGLGTDYVKALQTQLGVAVDGNAGTETNTALQAKIGTTADGQFQVNSIKALQAFIGATVDGNWGDETTAKFKAAIDAGKFGSAPPPVVTPSDPLVRTAGSLSVNKRTSPTTAAVPTIDPGVQPGVSVLIKSYTHGQSVQGNDIWYRLDGDIFVWSGGFTSQSIEGVPEDSAEIPAGPEIPEGTVFGIDIAWPQTGAFDWDKVKQSNTFVIIKAGGAETGIYGPAELADKHLAGVRSVGIRAGFYFFNNGNLPVKPQADKFIEVVSARIQPGDIVALDIENDGTAVPQFTPAQALEFAGYVEVALGVKTFMYINRSTMNNLDWSAVAAAGHPLWLAVLSGLDTSLQTPVKWWDRASITQFVVGPIDGYPSPVDRDYSTEAELDKYGFVELPPVVETPVADQVAELEAQVAQLQLTNSQLEVTIAQLTQSVDRLTQANADLTTENTELTQYRAAARAAGAEITTALDAIL
jgi:GH25 family lysozyme M1 (1,4-beta-N-acetylmuramidase)